jgi:hypothetical protein
VSEKEVSEDISEDEFPEVVISDIVGPESVVSVADKEGLESV